VCGGCTVAEGVSVKAYEVREPDEGHCVVVFATSGAEARRLGASELDTDFDGVESCRRAPQFDAYAEVGKVPPLALIEHGWWFECSHCGHQVSSDGEDSEGSPLEPVADGDRVYCNQAHQMAHWRERRDRTSRMDAVVEACALKFYGWPIRDLRGHEHYKAGGRETVACCDFDFPGRKGLHARWDLGEATVWISECDREAWAAMQANYGPKRDRRKLCTCDGAGRGPGRACVVKAGGLLGELWRCAESAEQDRARTKDKTP
jgi:hypothetical protein